MMLIKGQERYACIFDTASTLLRLRAGAECGAWLDAFIGSNVMPVAFYPTKERAATVLAKIAEQYRYPPSMPEAGKVYALPEE